MTTTPAIGARGGLAAGCRVAVVSVLACLGMFADGPPEYQVKAAYIYNFAKFVEWPNQSQAKNLAICVSGSDPFGGVLEGMVQGKVVHGLSVQVKHVGDTGDWDECQILFFGGAGNGRIEAALHRLRGHSILTIGEARSFAERGGMIGLVIENGRVRFEINTAAVEAAHLQISSHLLEVGRVVNAKN